MAVNPPGRNAKQTPIPAIPRTMKIVNPDGTVTRSGQQLLQQLQPASTASGTHAGRPAPGDMPDGALYVEIDRGVIYSNQNGVWQYVAGTMFGALSPDQRPADLGVNDGGFEFVANDTDPAIRGRDFIWSGTAWVETSPVLYGTHALRPLLADAPARCLYVEVDRGSVIYQNQGVGWQYIAGTMYGTLSPDQRPTDLGPAADAGFVFKTNVDPAQTFVWSGTDWIETTPIRYGTHAQRLAAIIANLASGMLWMETDRGSVIYQKQGGTWLYLAGTMWDTMSPDHRPTDLGVHDAGFDYRSTDPPPREFIWNQTAWVETTPGTGGGALTHPNVVTKVGATPGSIVEGGITDLSAANSNRVYITAAGLVGINTNNPLVPFAVAYTGTASTLITAARFASAGNPGGVGVGTAIEVGYDQVAVACARIGGYVDPNFGVALALQTNPTAGSGAPVTRVTILGNGNAGFGGVTSPTFQVQLSADSAGKPATSTWSVVSDIRLKQNIEPVDDDSLAILGKLNWVRYQYNGLADTPPDLKAIGLAAQELLEQLPEAVRSTKGKLRETDDEETDLLAIDYHYILVHSARAIQQLDAGLKRLTALVEKL